MSSMSQRLSDALVETVWSLSLGQHVCVVGAERDLLFYDGVLAEPADALQRLLTSRDFGFPSVLRWSPSQSPEGAPDPADDDDESQHAEAVARWLHDQLARPHADVALVIESADLVCEQLTHAGIDFLRRILALPVTTQDSPRRRFVVLLPDALDGIPDRIRRDARLRTVVNRPPAVDVRSRILESLAPVFFEWRDGELQEDLVRLTDGMRATDLRTLARLSHAHRLSASNPNRIIARLRAGLDQDPWQLLDDDRILQIERELYERVIGQDLVVAEVVSRLRTARVGLALQPRSEGGTRRPRMVLFLVGPTGVGKTEFVRALAESVFGDEQAVVRLDMGEFKSDLSLERFGGAPAGYVGYGDDTFAARVAARPFSIVLFDEIEKAHSQVWDRLLAVVDDGRLTTGTGETVSFGDTIICFTSNIGAKLIARRGAAATRAETVTELRAAVKQTLEEEKGRPEVWGRLEESIMVFDALRPELLPRLVGKFLEVLREDALDRYGVRIELDDEATAAVVRSAITEGPEAKRDGQWSGRTVRDQLAKIVLAPLSIFLAEKGLPRGVTVRVDVRATGTTCSMEA